MAATSTAKYIRMAPRKIRMVAREITGKPVGLALEALSFIPRRGAVVLRKVLNSAVSNAKAQGDVNLDSLFVKEITVGDGPTLRRYRPRAMGRATRIRKRTSHIKVVVDVW